MTVGLVLASCMLTWAADRRPASFAATYENYSRLMKDPHATREQWLKVIRSFVALKKRGSRFTRSRSLYLAGKSSLVLYGRYGHLEDLDRAIKFFHEVKQITRYNTRLPAVLQELRKAHFQHGARPRRAKRTPHPIRRLKRYHPGSDPTKSNPGSSALLARNFCDPESGTHPMQLPATTSSGLRPGVSRVYQGNPFCPTKRKVSKNPTQPRKVAAVPRFVKPQITPIPFQPKTKKRTFVVVIDPGHGGKDPGAVSRDKKLQEKDVTLLVSRKLKRWLVNKMPGIKVELTRNDDRFLTLSERSAKANSLKADLFISIHCNSYADAGAHGVETYYLSKASSKRAMRLAARENGIPLSRMSDVEATLLDLMMTSKKSESEKLAATVHRHLAGSINRRMRKSRDRGVKRGPFYVLLGATMPSILVECGYMSNSRDKGKLSNENHLHAIAQGIGSGTHEYLNELREVGSKDHFSSR
jgi:N-acetylmuramoyl-L-alanine amidase